MSTNIKHTYTHTLAHTQTYTFYYEGHHSIQRERELRVTANKLTTLQLHSSRCFKFQSIWGKYVYRWCTGQKFRASAGLLQLYDITEHQHGPHLRIIGSHHQILEGHTHWYEIRPHEDHLTIIKRRKQQWYGHVSRPSGLAKGKTILQGTVEGGRRQGRQWKR